MTDLNRSFCNWHLRKRDERSEEAIPAFGTRLCHLSFVMLLAICHSPTVSAADSSAPGEKIFQSRCFVCHGRDGRGSGPASQGLAQKPQDLTDPSWQRSVTDDQIKTVIRAGGAIIGKSGAMPPNPDLTNEDLNSLLEFVRHLANTR